MSMGSKKTILVIITAYNKEGSAGKVIEEVQTDLPRAAVAVI